MFRSHEENALDTYLQTGPFIEPVFRTTGYLGALQSRSKAFSPSINIGGYEYYLKNILTNNTIARSKLCMLFEVLYFSGVVRANVARFLKISGKLE